MIDKIALTLLIIGGLNWGCVGIFQFDLVAWICGGQTGIISRIVYILGCARRNLVYFTFIQRYRLRYCG